MTRQLLQVLQSVRVTSSVIANWRLIEVHS